MADKKITELNELSSPQANDLLPIVNVTTGETQKVKYSNIASNVDLSSYATISYVDGLIENVDSFTETVLFDTDITLDASKIYIEKNTNSSARSLTIPSANSGNLGKFIFVYKYYNNGYNIDCSGGGVSSTLKNAQDSVLYISDGTSWKPHLNISNELLLSLTQKEPTITTGTTSQYWRGDKTWQTFPTISVPNLDEVTDIGNTTTNQINFGGGTLTGALNYAPSVTLASSATVDIGAINSNNIIITGTTAISSFGTCAEGVIRNVRFTGVLGLTAVSNMPNGFPFTANGDEGIFRSLGAGAWTCVSYKAITTISNLNIPFFDTTTQRFVNSYFTQNASSVGVIMNNTANQNARLIGQGSGVNKWSIRQNDAGTYTTVSGSGGVVIGGDFESISVGYIWVKNGENQHSNTIHTFYTNAGTKYSELSSSGLALGSLTINASAQLDLQSTTKGFLPNRMTNAQRNAISSPAIGLMVYCTDTIEGLYIYKSTGWTFII